MTIDKKKLIELLVEKTSMNKQEIKAQLDQLIERILDAAKRGKALEIKEFGVFYFDEDGELRFDASEELSTEISFKYAGMKPVELKSERDTSIPDVEIEEESIDDESEESKLQDDEFLDDSFQEPETEPDALSTEDNTESESSKKSKPEKDDRSEESKDNIIDDPFSSEALEPLEEPVEKEEPTTSIEDIKPVASRKPVKKKDNTGIFIIIIIVIIAVLIGGYFYYVGTQSQGLSNSASQTSAGQVDVDSNEPGNLSDENLATDPQPETTQSTESNEDGSEGNQESTEQMAPDESIDEQIVSDEGISASQTDQDLYGLMGSVIEEANNGYSIVLHSFRNEDNAIEASNRLREDEYRVLVTSRTVFENTVWRVSVGQFETLEDAQRATTQLPDPYNTQNFIQRIRTN